MFNILTITFPIYALIALGYFVVRRGVFAAKDMHVFGRYVLNIALPALLFNAVATRPVTEIFNLGYMTVYLGAGLATMAICYVWFSFTGIDKTRRVVAVLGASSPNSGFVGYPVLLLAFPDLAGIALALNMLVENFVLIPISLALLEASRAYHERSIFSQTTKIVTNVLKRPMVLALILGLLVSLSGITLPAVATKLLTMLSASASALALFVIGGALVGRSKQANHWLAFQISLGKLLLFPALAALITIGLPLVGINALSSEMRAVVILSSAMPTFGIYSVLVQEYGQEGLASYTQLIATLGAFFTLTVLLAILA